MLFGLLYPITSTTCKFCCFDICATVTPPPPIPSPTTFLCLSTFYPSLPSHSKSKGGEFSIFSTQHGLIMVRACEGVTKLTSLHNHPNFFQPFISFSINSFSTNNLSLPHSLCSLSGAPDRTDDFMNFMLQVRKERRDLDEPVIVHCR